MAAMPLRIAASWCYSGIYLQLQSRAAALTAMRCGGFSAAVSQKTKNTAQQARESLQAMFSVHGRDDDF